MAEARRRILTVFAGLPGGQTSGAQRMAWRTTAALARRGHIVAVRTDAAPPSEVDTAFAEPAGFVPDVVHAYDLALPGAVVLARDLARRCGAVFVLTPASAPSVWPDVDLGARLCAAAEALFLLTPAEAAALRAFGADPARLRTLPSAPDLAGRPDPDGFRARHGIAGPLVLFLGRRVATKGYRVLLDAAPRVWADHPGTTFAFAGPYAEPGAAAAFAAADPRIRDLGVLDEQAKHDALAACDVFCLPTSADVFPLVFAEAWSLARPVVTGRFPGVRDVVGDGVDGLVVAARAADVAAAVGRLLADPALRAALGARGRARVAATMGWDRVAAAVEAGYPGYRTTFSAPPRSNRS
ncbi:glycosyltransferase family 4 protein [Dactylosporangium sp. AC04546]|uniref:glycosyltransferase family 4 protein n=1 Tax=Dactylosporangium sp. AC04546 TaxID=2862460 RepID=UPI001EDC9BAF|nr:glycosyltransferase family 4 protein [Dactylosporangium sp. AC04546]WVK81302.1 glycosyltransferase family 4 protein [Dactylosporangium sp. AC04546]